ncbi:RAMP superfamily CRISPR-associated protein [Lyngbya confervoides]|uniref:RAMP superfamily CRISPR-associated protein n=1 Tax=Lyngbya confervoides BDU141951 TaxID=1574623 RepID=A0ABD4T664_9CYAN|nr:RAMP superfamily CRISPR-associated protein [Lyngbya confervoides]MCM1983757.1 RAMP superfamily CRISPR-associated protein [Lyngbya confervoides BDU141951]
MIQLQSLVGHEPENISLSITIQSALSIGAGGSSGSLADKPMIRKTNGQLIIPASHLKGRLRHECEKIARGLGWEICESPQADSMCPSSHHQPEHHCLACQIFGSPSLPSRLLFDDLVCPLTDSTFFEVLRPGVTINRRRKVAEDQKLYFLETSPQNAKLSFTGSIQLQPGYPEQTIPLVLAGLSLIRALGGSKSSGLGWIAVNSQDFPTPTETDWFKLLPKRGEG